MKLKSIVTTLVKEVSVVAKQEYVVKELSVVAKQEYISLVQDI